MPIPIQRPDFQQGTVDAFGLKGKTPFILDEVTVPVVQTLDLERSPYTLVPKRTMISSFVDASTDGERLMLFAFPLNGFFGSLEWIAFTPQNNFTDNPTAGDASKNQPQRLSILFGSKSQFESLVGFTPAFGFPWISLNQIPVLGSGSAGQFNAGLFLQAASFTGNTGPLSTIASVNVGDIMDGAGAAGNAGPATVQYHFDPPLPLYQQNGQASAIGIVQNHIGQLTDNPVPVDISMKGSTYPESI